MKLTAFFNLIRYRNLLIIGLIQCLLEFVLLPKYGVKLNLSLIHFLILTTSTLSIAAAGNVYNDILDIRTDSINKYSKRIVSKIISKKTALNWYYVLNLLGLILGSYLCFSLDNPILIILFLIPIIILYLYSKWLKSTILVGNIAVSGLIGLSILIVPLFESIPLNSIPFRIIIGLSFFAFSINLVREIIKDIEDVNGDLASHLKTLPIVFGRKRASLTAMTLSIVLTMILIAFTVLGNNHSKTLRVYLIIMVIIPLLYFISKVKIAKSKKDYTYLSNLLKIIMILGILSIFTI